MKAILEFNHDIKDGTLLVNSGQTFVVGDEGAHEIRFTAKDGGAPADLAGATCQALCVLSNRATASASATKTGNVISVLFPASFYALAGNAYLLLRVSMSGVKYDLLCLRYNLVAGTTSTVYDPSGELPDLSDFQAAIDAANAATGEANTAASNANTKAGLANTAAGAANTAASTANAAADNANSAATAASEASSNANTKAGLANTAAGNANSAAQTAATAANNANTAASDVNAAKEGANAAAAAANEAAEAANTAASAATGAAEQATSAASAAQTAATAAGNAASDAQNAASGVVAATEAAQAAAQEASDASSDAVLATGDANDAADAANAAAGAANTAATGANTAKAAADTAAGAATSAAGQATSAASAAQMGAAAANAAAAKIDGMTVETSVVPFGTTPTATITEVDGHKHVAIETERGPQGAAYTIKGVAYATLADLAAAVPNPAEGDQYNVGAAAPYHVYRWTGAAWEDQGELQGPGGEAGFSPLANVGKSGNTTTITITDQLGTTSAQVMDGVDGDNGVTFTPAVNSAGVMSFTNDGGLDNPAPVNLATAAAAVVPAVRFDIDQTSAYDAAAKARARQNMGAQQAMTAGSDYRAGVVDTVVNLTAAGWSGSAAPYTQTVSVVGLLAASKGVEVGLSDTATQTQRTAARSAMIAPTGIADGQITVVADGDVPTIDLPMLVRRDS